MAMASVTTLLATSMAAAVQAIRLLMAVGGGRSDDLGFWKNPEFSEEISNLLHPWTYENAPENILHAYAYINAATQEEKDSILGMLELRRTK